MSWRPAVIVTVLTLMAVVVLPVVWSPIDPVAYSPATMPELSGPLASNARLRNATLLGKGRILGSEDVEVGADGWIYCGVEDGAVLRLRESHGQEEIEVFASTGGRPLGLDFDSAGTLWVADLRLGLVAIDVQGKVESRSTTAGGVPIHFADDVAVAGNGKVYFSDASTRFGPREVQRDALEARPHGRLLEHDPVADTTRVLLEGLYFANGVAVSPDSRYVLVAETFRYRIRRYWLTGPDAGSDEVFIDNLPGFPDGVSSDGEETFWIALYGLRDQRLDRYVHPRPWLKRLIAHLPQAWLGGTDSYGLVIAADPTGRIGLSLHDPGGTRISYVTSAEEYGGALYLGTVVGDAIGRYVLP